MSVIYIVTNPEYGWDCIVGVYDESSTDFERLKGYFPQKEGYFIFKKEVEIFNEEDFK